MAKKSGPHNATAMLGEALSAMKLPNVRTLGGNATLPTVGATVGVVRGVGVGVAATDVANKGLYVHVEPELTDAKIPFNVSIH